VGVPKDLLRPWQAVDMAALVQAFPPPPEYFERDYFLEPDVIAHLQDARLREEIHRASKVPFFERHWAKAGFDPQRYRSRADHAAIPTYDTDDIRASLEAHPPYGDYQGVSVRAARTTPMRVYTSGGTTGRPRPTLYTWWDRLVGSLTTARALYLQGLQPGDTVLNAWAYSMHNGAWAFDEATFGWLNCVVLTAGTGNVTPSRSQVELALEFGANTITTSPDYLLRLAEVAREAGYDPHRDFAIRMFSTPGQNRKVSDAWGVPVYDGYGTHELQHVAAECPARGGLHIWEDCFVVEIIDPATGQVLEDGEEGNVVVTCLYKTGSPHVRFDTRDRSRLFPRSRCECGSWLQKMDYFGGRSDSMVKLRGISVVPEAVGGIVSQDHRVTDDWYVVIERDANGRDDMRVRVTTPSPPEQWPTVVTEIEGRLQDHFGVRIAVELGPEGSLDELTGRGARSMLKRFEDRRGA
jgi:phenylacetate-CoA ligase